MYTATTDEVIIRDLLRIPNALIESCPFEDNATGINIGGEWI